LNNEDEDPHQAAEATSCCHHGNPEEADEPAYSYGASVRYSPCLEDESTSFVTGAGGIGLTTTYTVPPTPASTTSGSVAGGLAGDEAGELTPVGSLRSGGGGRRTAGKKIRTAFSALVEDDGATSTGRNSITGSKDEEPFSPGEDTSVVGAEISSTSVSLEGCYVDVALGWTSTYAVDVQTVVF
jgi:hypothetical protein